MNNNNHHHTSRTHDALETLTEELLCFGGMVAQLLDHMSRFSAAGLSAPDAPPFNVVLHDMFVGTLRPLAKRHPAAELERLARLLSEIMDTIEDEIYLVPPEAIDDLPPDAPETG